MIRPQISVKWAVASVAVRLLFTTTLFPVEAPTAQQTSPASADKGNKSSVTLQHQLLQGR